jgi:predicted short-subunit dehydrogenase-like oxidoreductase (DUF2520 family)
VGQALGRLLAESGYEITDVVCRTTSSAREAVRFVGAGRAVTARSLGRLRGEVALVATPDDAIREVAKRMASGAPAFGVALHTSGSLPASELAALALRGVAVGSIHPLQSFATPELGTARVAGSVFALDGDRQAVAVARRMALDVGGRPVRLRAGTKALYHAAAVLAAGHVTALLDMSLEAMWASGMTDDEALAAVLPLVRGVVTSVGEAGPAAALTGPFARGDEGTIGRNRAALAALSPEIAAVYDLLGARSRQMKTVHETRESARK